MKGFRLFWEQTDEQEENIKATLKKLPPAHQALIGQYKIKWHGDNTLQGDDGHIGIVNPNTKTMTIAAPWNYGREYTFLHEIGHKIWERFVAPNSTLVKQWHQIVKLNKNRMKQNDEELFCMAYSNHYAKNKIVVHTHPEWDRFIKNLPK
jgi:hypothetical protein